MIPGFRSTVAAAGFVLLSASAGLAGSIECSKIGTAYDKFFLDGNNRVQAVLGEYKALPATATEQQKDAVRKKFCAVGGEVVGFYKFIQAMAQDCAAQGDKMDDLLKVINDQLTQAQQGVKAPCG